MCVQTRGAHNCVFGKLKLSCLSKQAFFATFFSFAEYCVLCGRFQKFCLCRAVLGIRDQISPDVHVNITRAIFVVLIIRKLYNHDWLIIHQLPQKNMLIHLSCGHNRCSIKQKSSLKWIVLNQRQIDTRSTSNLKSMSGFRHIVNSTF